MGVQKKAEVAASATHESRFRVGSFWLISGGILGIVVTTVNTMVDGGIYIMVQRFVGRDACLEGWNSSEVYTMFGISIVTTLIFARWLWVLRGSIGANSAADDPEWSAFQRRWFTIGIFAAFFLAAPVKWLYILALSYCYGA